MLRLLHYLILNHQLNQLMTEQSVLVRRFFSTQVNNSLQFLTQVRKAISQWNHRLMYPLEQQISSRRILLNQHLEQLQDIKNRRATTGGQMNALAAMMTEIDDELANARQTLHALKTPPHQYQGNVVSITQGHQASN